MGLQALTVRGPIPGSRPAYGLRHSAGVTGVSAHSVHQPENHSNVGEYFTDIMTIKHQSFD